MFWHIILTYSFDILEVFIMYVIPLSNVSRHFGNSFAKIILLTLVIDRELLLDIVIILGLIYY